MQRFRTLRIHGREGRRATRVMVLLGLACTALTLVVTGPAQASAPTNLTGEFLSSLPPATLTSGACTPLGDSNFTFTASGSASAPYAGTFTETGTVTIGPQTEEFTPGQFRGEITEFEASFTITSAEGTVSGTTSFVPAGGFNKGSCFGASPGTGAAQILVSDLVYSATISTPIGEATDQGTTWANFNGYFINPGANSSSLQFREAFTSTAPPPSDTTPPVVTGVPDRSPNVAGWYNADVAIDWRSVDPEPSSGTPADPADTIAATEGAGGVHRSGQSCDPANNCVTGSITLSIDKTAPSVTCAPAPRFTVNEPGASIAATVDDPLSGAVASTVSKSVSTVLAGTFTVDLTGSDVAGNSRRVSCSYSVGYRFEGFFAPIDKLPTVNKANAGQAIPIKWRITDYNGAGISDPASFVSVTSGSTSCSSADPLDDLETYSGSSGLLYHQDGNWQFNWKTPKSYAGQCRIMRLTLADGDQTHTAEFRFK